MTELCDLECAPCRGGVPPMAPEEIATYLTRLGGGWEVIDHHHLTKTYEFPDFATALAFTNAMGAVAEAQGHHPDIYLAWGKVQLTIWTHKIDGLAEADFVLAAKADRLAR
ncbi:MAG: 4a-hydroxytetrahydrobiopterin dehydratase [Myxococcales bacterium FL481]|nr:MAG: 4a-hydroxytetrahydrobiopterin dehydratase [Myxococcales bacterium FL481]